MGMGVPPVKIQQSRTQYERLAQQSEYMTRPVERFHGMKEEKRPPSWIFGRRIGVLGRARWLMHN